MRELRRSDVDPRPIRQFSLWFDDASRAGLALPHACTLSTAGTDGRPSARMVLLKGFDERGFVFCTNYDSRKARELEANPFASLVFYWQPLGRQIRIEGKVSPTSAEESDALYRDRPLEARIGAGASPQSRVLRDRGELERRLEDARRLSADAAPPRPLHWGGYRLVPDRIEFWLNREHRLHDRLEYTRRPGGSWTIERLAP